jgi:DNA polymerase III subunit alpha, Gram-positive type
MHDKLKLLLEQINMSLEYYSYFNDGKLDKIVGNKSKDTYTFFIVLKDVLPLNVYLILYKLLKDTYNDFKVKIDVIYDNDNNHLSDYFNYTIDSFSSELPLLEVYKDCCISAEDSLIKLEVGNKAELIKFESVKDKIIKKLKSMGFKDVNVEITINTSKYDDVKESITKDIDVKSIKNKISKKTESNIIMGEEIKTKVTPIKEIYLEENNIAVEALVFGIDYFESPKSNFKIITLKLHDKTDSIFCKMFIKDDSEYQVYKDKLKIGNWYKIRGYTKNDQYSKELVINARDINISKIVEEKIKDEYKEKRVELHAHTFMSQMDGMIEPKKLIKQAHEWGHKAIAVTDHSSVQSFPDVYHTVKDLNKGKETDRFKALYGVELVMIDDAVDIVIRENDTRMLDNTYVVFDFETTGFNAGGKDQIIEVGAVLLKDGKIIDKFSELIDPKRELPAKITEITGITDEMLKGMDDEETVIKRFIEWYKDYPMVAHNAKFDVSFLEMCYQKYKLGVFNNTVIDTLELSRTLDSSFARHNLSALVKRYDIPFDEDNHHRGDYDAEATALVFQKMMKKMDDRNIEKISDIKKLVAKDEIFKFGRAYHINLIATNKAGLKNLFKLVSLASTKYLYKTPRIPRSEILDNKEGLLLGSGCYESEVFIQARSKSEEELSNIINFYDYIEVQPLDCYDHLLQMNDFATKNELIEHVKKIIRVTEDAGKIMVATGDVHHMTKEDKIYRQILVNQKVPGGGRHPLARSNILEIPSNHFRTTDEMINDFSFIDSKLAHKIVIDNPNKIADLVEELEVIIETGGVPFSPKIENSEQIVKDLVYNKANELYGDPLPEIVKDRIEKELTGIIKGGFDVIYLISQKLVKKSNDDGYIVGSRGSVGSSFVATLMGITEVNPLSAHYRCPSCKHTIFEEDNVSLGSVYSSGFDLPNKECPKCNTLMAKDGQDMPFATFLGFDADKVPDIDLNFSGEYQAKAHEYTKELFGEDNVYRAGTIGTVADKTAYGFAKGYCEDKGIILRGAEVERLALGCTGVKRTTGQHPGGIVVVPDYMDVFDFTPFQYPADDVNSTWKTTHFDYHAIDQDLLKLDILGHDDPTILKLLLDATGVKVEDIPFDDPKVMSIFRSPNALGVTKDDINCETGTLGIPEFGTNFTINMLVDTQPETFAELTKLSGLSHGTDVWTGNAQDLIRKKVCDFKEVIGCRDDIMVYLTYNGLKPKDAFKIMEFVRKGKPSKEKEAWEKFKDQMKEAGIVDWYIDSCYKIKYMFPKAHAAAYVMSAFRIAWFKVYYPIHYYSAYFSIRSTDFDLSVMIKGKDAIKARITEILLKGKEATNKELDIVETLQIAQEATARGFRFGNIDLLKSHDKYFLVAEDERTLIPPFRALDGLGATVAGKIIEERLKAPFLSVEDFQKRGKVSSTLIDKMRIMKILDDLDESSQLSLF